MQKEQQKHKTKQQKLFSIAKEISKNDNRKTDT